jgi:hypothetical protein
LKVTDSTKKTPQNGQQQTADQGTLMSLSRSNLSSLDGLEGINGILALGPFHQAIGSPFSSTGRQLENGRKVTWSHEFLTAALFDFCSILL